METLKKVLLFFLGVLVACVGTLLFMLFHYPTYGGFGIGDWMQVLGHSVPQHMTVMGYVMALPLLLSLLALWLPHKRRLWDRRERPNWHTRFMMVYGALMAVLLMLIWGVNVGLYGYWGIVLDGTALIYLMDNPADAIAEAPLWAVIVLTVLLVLLCWWMGRTMKRLFLPSQGRTPLSLRNKLWMTGFVLVLCGLDFLAIRGGWTPATMNPGRAYFSDAMALNHAAVDPVFNFFYSIGKDKRFDKQYRFMSDEEALAAWEELNRETVSHASDLLTPTDLTLTDGLTTAMDSLAADTLSGRRLLLTSQRPNILLILFESFSGSACRYLTPQAEEGWMPNVNRALQEGVAFTRFYANSFRTDRGVAATLAAYPGQPTNSVMKDQSKCDNLQYLSKRLGEAGYQLQFLHGGDVNFTNMQGFLRSGGFVDIMGDTHFPISERLDKWGVRDDMMFDYVAQEIISEKDQPWFKAFLTLSSHEPFEVPFHHFDDPYLNSVAYTDSCFGSFIDRLKAEPEVWDNLLIIGLPDHCYARFPAEIQQHDPMRYHIPMFWTGGAVTGHSDISVIGQQTDLAATLLGQLDIDHADFNFSKDLFDPEQGHYAFYAFSDGFGLLTDSCQYVQDNKRSGVGLQPGTSDPDGKAERWGKAYLQRLYDDLQKR